jgi:hypothetical protein
MNADVERLIQKHHRNGILVDTNLLLMWIVSSTDIRLVGRNRTDRYTADHFQTLNEFLARFRQVVTTPHILTEVAYFVSNYQKPNPHD